jgi:RimJ/RimL family protein N-acetyltransferase
MQSTHIYESNRARRPRIVRADGWPFGTAPYPYRAFPEGYADAPEAKTRLVDRLLGIGQTLTERARRQQAVVAGAYVDLLWAPFRAYGGAASPDELGEIYMRGKSDFREEDRILALADGTCVTVREIKSEDAPALQQLVDRLSERTIRLRYFGPMKELSDEQARRFAEVDGTDRYALVALDPEDEEKIVAVVRYDRERDTNRAEYAALVEDRFQGLGLGYGLTRALIEAARERGIRDFEALVLPENRDMARLLRSLDLPERVRREDGVKHFSIDLSPEKAAVSGGR